MLYIRIIVIYFIINNNLVENNDITENSSLPIEECDVKPIKNVMNKNKRKKKDFDIEENEVPGMFIIVIWRSLSLFFTLLMNLSIFIIYHIRYYNSIYNSDHNYYQYKLIIVLVIFIIF